MHDRGGKPALRSSFRNPLRSSRRDGAAGCRVGRLRAAAWLLAIPFALACGAGGSEPAPLAAPCRALPESPAPEGASVVLVLNDTMRRDRMGIHGGPARTPNFDGFARENVWFERAVAQAPWTKPSVATLFTSLYPSQHGVVTHPSHQMEAGEALGRSLVSSDRLPDGASTLAEAYRAAGFRTAAFVANPWMDRRFGFEQGFEVYDDSFARWDVPGERVVEAALAWVAGLDPGERYFLYVHTIDTHRPYPALTWEEVEEALAQPSPPGELSLKARREIMSLIRIEGPRPPGVRPPGKRRVLKRAYDKGIERWDTAFGALLAGLRKDARFDRTAILVTSDHGEALYRRGYGNHGLSLYQADLAVPMAARLPGAQPGPVDCRVGLIDVMPTLCEWSGLDCPAGMTGRTFFAAGPVEDAPESVYFGEAALIDLDQRAAYRGRYKLIHSPGPRAEANPPPSPWSLFDLREDPSEERDLLAESPGSEAVERAFASLRLALDEAAAGGPVLEREGAPVDPELEQRLRSLGYVE